MGRLWIQKIQRFFIVNSLYVQDIQENRLYADLRFENLTVPHKHLVYIVTPILKMTVLCLYHSLPHKRFANIKVTNIINHWTS